MVAPIHTARRYLASRAIVALFGIQLAFLLATFTEPFDSVAAVTIPVTTHAQFINGFTDLLFAPEYAGLWDPLATLLVLPFIYYATAIIVTAFGRAISRFGRQRFSR